jgi:hypothetical protein
MFLFVSRVVVSSSLRSLHSLSLLDDRDGKMRFLDVETGLSMLSMVKGVIHEIVVRKGWRE